MTTASRVPATPSARRCHGVYVLVWFLWVLGVGTGTNWCQLVSSGDRLPVPGEAVGCRREKPRLSSGEVFEAYPQRSLPEGRPGRRGTRTEPTPEGAAVLVPTFLRCHPSGCRFGVPFRGARAKERAPVGGRGLRERTQRAVERDARSWQSIRPLVPPHRGRNRVFAWGGSPRPGRRGVRGGGEGDEREPALIRLRGRKERGEKHPRRSLTLRGLS